MASRQSPPPVTPSAGLAQRAAAPVTPSVGLAQRGRSRGVLALLLLCGCLDPWRPVSYVEGLRLLAIEAEPPDLAPGQSTRLDALVVDPRDPRRANTLIWFACDPDPADPDQPACAEYATLEEVNSGEFTDASALPEGVRPLGMSPPPGSLDAPIVYQSPADTFATTAADDPRRTRGVLAIVLVLVIGAPPPESYPPTSEQLQELLAKVQSGEVDSLVGIKRIRISEEATRNANPTIAGVRLGEELWPAGLRPAKVHPGVSYPLVAVAAEGAQERYTALDAENRPVEKDERLIASWFTTFGELSEPRTVAGAEGARLAVPFLFEALPVDRRATLYLALRDGRGGADTLTRGLFVCDPFRAAPALTSVEPGSGPPGTLVRLRGEGLDDLLDVRVGAGWLAGGRCDAADGVYLGSLPSDAAPGVQPLVPRGKSCDADPSLGFEVVAP